MSTTHNPQHTIWKILLSECAVRHHVCLRSFQACDEELCAGYPCAIIADGLLLWGEGTADHNANLHIDIDIRCLD